MKWTLGGAGGAGARLICPGCHATVAGREVLFVCPQPRCPARTLDLPGRPAAWADKPVFRPARYDESVPCPYSMHRAHLKLCPHCWHPLQPPRDEAATVAIIGSTASGKTCYTTGLVRQIERRLARPTSHEMSLEWEDDAGRRYFDEQKRSIFVDNQLPEGTQKEAPLKTLQITLRFSLRGWRARLLHGPRGVVRLVFPDPSGESFDNLADLYFLGTLFAARAIILMVDPMMSEDYRARLKAAGKAAPPYEAADPAVALGNYVQVLRRQTGRDSGLLDRQLAVVLGKCDEEGLFDPDDRRYGGMFPVQGRFYDARLAADISDRVAATLGTDLGLHHVVSLARQNFRDVSFFAVSALGRPPVRTQVKGAGLKVRLVDPEPRRVEEPLLWILHRWGYL